MRVLTACASVGLLFGLACSNSQFGGSSGKTPAIDGKKDKGTKDDAGDDADCGEASKDDCGNESGGPGLETEGGNGNKVPGGTDTDDQLGNPADDADQANTKTGTGTDGDIATDDGEITKVGTSAVGFTFDGKASFCLDWKAGKIIVTKLYEKYFTVSATYEAVSASGKKTEVKIQGAGEFQLPGTWGDKVCDATATMQGFTATTAGNRENQPVIQTTKQGTQACFLLDDAEGDRGGLVIMKGVDFNIKKC